MHHARLWIFLGAIGCVVLLLPVFFHGLEYPDEGYLLNSATRVLQGQIPYKDFDFVYTPLSIYLTTFSFLLLGTSVLAERIMTLLLSLATTYVLYLITRQYTKSPLLQLLPSACYFLWGPLHINFLWPSMLAGDAAIFTTYFLTKQLNTAQHRYSLFVGIGVMITFLCKQNFGIAVLVTAGCSYLLLKQLRKNQPIRMILFGICTSLLLFFWWLTVTNSFTAFLTNFYVNVIQQIVLQHTLDTPFLSPPYSLLTPFKLIFYLFPLLVSLTAIYFTYKAHKPHLAPLSFVSLFMYLFGIRPVTDYIHLTPLLSLSGLSLLALLLSTKQRVRIIMGITTAFLLASGLYTTFFIGYYRWGQSLSNQTTFVSNPRINIWTDAVTARNIAAVTKAVQERTKSSEYIFVDSYSPMIYFFTNRQNPTRYDYLGIPKSYQMQAIHDLRVKKVPLVLIPYLARGSSDLLTKYIIPHYHQTRMADDTQVWEK